jgi:hypothetical protein
VTASPLSADALDANRRGELSADQRRGFDNLAASQRRSALSAAAMLFAGALLVALFGSPDAFASRMIASSIAATIAAVVFLRAVTGADALTRDVKSGQVLSTEGAIGRHSISGRISTRFLDVGDSRFKVGRSTYAAAQEAGFARVYYLPHSRKVVNIERLPDAPLPSSLTPRDIVEKVGAGLFGPTRRARNEARAEVAAVGNALNASLTTGEAPMPPSEAASLAEAIVGTWGNQLITATFSADGHVSLRMFGTSREGRWSVDAEGRLATDVLGHEGAADARIVGDTLTVAVDGQGMTFSRRRAD